jgi:hypothetical protein
MEVIIVSGASHAIGSRPPIVGWVTICVHAALFTQNSLPLQRSIRLNLERVRLSLLSPKPPTPVVMGFSGICVQIADGLE